MTFKKRQHLRDKTLAVGREWIVVSVPGSDDGSEPTLWFAVERSGGRRSSAGFATYDEALTEAQIRNGLRPKEQR